MTKTLRSFLLISSGVLALGLTACQTASTPPSMNEAEMVDRALIRAADQVAAQGITQDSLQILEKVYKRNPQDPEGAVRYARALRETGDATKAAIVLKPFAEDPNTSPVLKMEYAAVQLEAGRYEIAEETARTALKQEPESGYGYHLLGTAQAAQGLHEDAEQSFRKALANWTGDPVPVMNNLALSLAAQHKLDEAVDILEQAKEADPSRVEIERNLRIVKALQETFSYEPSAGRGNAPVNPKE